jgi:hypothetical protein
MPKICHNLNYKGDKPVGGSSPSSHNHISRRYAVMDEQTTTRYSEKSQHAKACARCRSKKPTSEFTVRSANKDGLSSWCKACESEARRHRKKTGKVLTQERLKSLLDYDPLTGLFAWKMLRGGRTVNSAAGSKNGNGYVTISIDSRSYNASRLAYLWTEGYFPEHDVDHRDRVRDNDRWDNLRHATRQCNNRNCSPSIRNKSGVIGVFWHNLRRKWVSKIGVDRKKITLGYYETKKEAAKARWDAEVKYGFPNCNTTSSAFLFLQGAG